MTSELIAPISVDLRAADNRMDIIKGMEHLNIKDEVLGAGLSVESGDWLVKGASAMALPGLSAVANTYPVWVGNDQYDAQATGNVTILTNGGFIYRTSKFVAGSYTAGQNLTVKDLGGGEKVPSAASGGDPVLARVYTAPDSKGVMEIQVLDR
jgi:hypothetical protein